MFCYFFFQEKQFLYNDFSCSLIEVALCYKIIAEKGSNKRRSLKYNIVFQTGKQYRKNANT